MPMDAEPVEQANGVYILLVTAGSRQPRLERPEGRQGPYFVSHFTTCPDAAQHTRRRK